MPDKGSAERVTGTFNEPGFSTKAVDMSIPCSWVSTLLSSWPGARATGQGPMASNGCVADRLMSPHTRHQTERFSPTGTEGADPRTELPFSFSVQVSLVYARQCSGCVASTWYYYFTSLDHVRLSISTRPFRVSLNKVPEYQLAHFVDSGQSCGCQS